MWMQESVSACDLLPQHSAPYNDILDSIRDIINWFNDIMNVFLDIIK